MTIRSPYGELTISQLAVELTIDHPVSSKTGFSTGLLRLRLVPLVPSNEEQLVDLSEGRYDPTYPYELSDNVQRTGYIGPGQSEAMGYPITNDALR